MRNSIYRKLALMGIMKNKKIYLPYIIASMVMVTMCYIMNFLALTPFMENMQGIDMIREMFTWGSIIVAIFAAIFLFYTNTFIMKNRKKEFGLYNVLGMNKGNIGWILFWENLFIGIVAIVLGILIGILLSKLSELFLLNLIKAPVNYSFRVPKGAIVNILKVYVIIFTIIFLNCLRQIKFNSIISLLNSQRSGEKPVKGHMIIGILGIILLGIGYYLAIKINDMYTAIFMFFIAVIFVILGTYLVMIFGSVVLCKCLQKNKKYYYNKKHFVAVSSMTYRMKRNGASLASICILLTMILVTISTTGSLYFSVEDLLAGFQVYGQSKVEFVKEVYSFYGGFLGLGILISLLFIICAVLIIYYKQISEGYEDKSSFILMQKIGMTKDEIRKNINSQLVIVFLLPVIFAGMHLSFAFPMLKMILNGMLTNNGGENNNIFFYVSLTAFGICIVIYMLVYKITSRGYLKIVGEMSEKKNI